METKDATVKKDENENIIDDTKKTSVDSIREELEELLHSLSCGYICAMM